MFNNSKIKAMKKLQDSEMEHVSGGYSAPECKAVQALAAAIERDGGDWDEWCTLYDKYC